ncbi:acyl-CoA ligase (AMP-forming), exosortase A system-associated [Kineobactrum sediminis]|uniref:Acyl-CoA ligase (AMP-forming), exosortase A system-associated n=1 Tax=Kineobactrum sediminis TaxID=1905677 RepID=A0A2N5XZI1_9GAMM|nr:acyl-CoA ligase (AMP-forming), exosortase A system-associated [Kineobactrum sediminis]PLW81546.1 acyl-CoA ligase (AMP-forming), exosortase A system-associated [Kineobactrum sediminis]
MADLLHELIATRAAGDGDQPALLYRATSLTYAQLWAEVECAANGLLATGINAGDRVAVYLPKQIETATALFGAAAAGACFVPVNPLLKPRQVNYILQHSQARVLVTSAQRLQLLADELAECDQLKTILLVDELTGERGEAVARQLADFTIINWPQLRTTPPQTPHRRIDSDRVAILYTSGSTGNPKGVVLSHRNMVAGARSVAQYLENTPGDRLLAVLPLSFDAGLSQLTTAFSAGASVVLMDYLLPRDVLKAVQRYQVTGLAAVPPLWNQLIQQDWPPAVAENLRYVTNTGGAMPVATTRELRQRLPNTRVFLMYGLTEAFRSTYLPPEQLDLRPQSIGKAIPNAEILVVNEAGELCAPNEPGELVHRGALVALGYWNDAEKTAERFKPCPAQDAALPLPELAVWSGDQVVKDEEGYLYFVSRKDDMIKTSGYRVSPTEVEEIAYNSGLVAGAAALGLAHGLLGQAIALVVTPGQGTGEHDTVAAELLAYCQRELPNFMVPSRIVVRDTLPHNQNGKIDRRALGAEYATLFEDTSA